MATVPVQSRVCAAIDLAHAARSDQSLDAICPQLCTGGERLCSVLHFSHDLDCRRSYDGFGGAPCASSDTTSWRSAESPRILSTVSRLPV